MKAAPASLLNVVALVALASLAVARPAAARVERHAVIIGNDRGAPDEAPLRWAESDARKVYDVLKNLGDFAPENMLLLQGESPDVVRRAIIATNDRIRSSAGLTDREVFLVVYYSGHADAEALHLGGAPLAVRELEQLVRGSSAAFRLLVLDSCRSGALTQVKGAAGRAPPFPIAVEQRLAGEGAVFWSASAANEDAQESDDIKGSFFTHFLVSGLLGAADEDGDGAIALDEAYRYAFQNTLRASSQTLAGTQHPTYRYEVRGRGGLALTRVGGARNRATVTFPPGAAYLLFEGGRDGPVVGELGLRDGSRRLSLKAGTYFVRGRGAGYLLEGELTVAAGQEHALDERRLERIEYARLTRKGGAASIVSGPLGAFRLRSPLAGGGAPCAGLLAGWAWATERLTVSPRLGACRQTRDNDVLSATTTEVDAGLRLSHAWDRGRVAIDVGVTAAVGLLHQTYETAGRAPPRTTLLFQLAAGAGLSVALGGGVYVLGEGAFGSDLFRRRDSHTGATAIATPFTWTATLGLGKVWPSR